MKKIPYLLIPLPLIREIFRNPDRGINDIFDYGIYKSAFTQKTDDTNAYKQVIYCMYRGGLTLSLQDKINTLIEDGIFNYDEEYSGFNGSEFYPEDNIIELDEYCNTDNTLKDEIIEFHKLRQGKDVLGLEYNIEAVANTYHKYGKFDGYPLISVSVKMMLDYYSNPKDKYEKALFAMYLGIRSLIGNRDYACTTADMVKCRMFGAKEKKELDFILKDASISKAYKTYTTRHYYDKMMKDLRVFNFIQSEIGYYRRTYISCKLSMMELADVIVRIRKEKSLTQRRNEVDKEKKDILHYLKSKV